MNVVDDGDNVQANWYKAEQYCRFHGMHLASINSEEEQRNLQEHIQSFGEFNPKCFSVVIVNVHQY